jgi:hypothetical protein
MTIRTGTAVGNDWTLCDAEFRVQEFQDFWTGVRSSSILLEPLYMKRTSKPLHQHLHRILELAETIPQFEFPALSLMAEPF